MNTSPDVNTELTLSLLKPDITERNLTGAANSRIETAGFEIIAQKRLHLTYDQAALFFTLCIKNALFLIASAVP